MTNTVPKYSILALCTTTTVHVHVVIQPILKGLSHYFLHFFLFYRSYHIAWHIMSCHTLERQFPSLPYSLPLHTPHIPIRSSHALVTK